MSLPGTSATSGHVGVESETRRTTDNRPGRVNESALVKFRIKDFEGEYFHYTGDLFFIYKSGHLMRLTCQKRPS
jgi:hypothetical protein